MATDPDAVDGPKKKPARSVGALVALGAVAVTIPLLLYAARNSPDREDRLHDPLELSNEAELRSIVQAISGVIQAHPGEEEDRALRALDAAGAAGQPAALLVADGQATGALPFQPAPELAARLRALRPLPTPPRAARACCPGPTRWWMWNPAHPAHPASLAKSSSAKEPAGSRAGCLRFVVRGF